MISVFNPFYQRSISFIQEKILPFVIQHKKIASIAAVALSAFTLAILIIRHLKNRKLIPLEKPRGEKGAEKIGQPSQKGKTSGTDPNKSFDLQWRAACELLNSRKSAEAAPLFKQLLESYPENENVLNLYVNVLKGLNRHDDALEECQKLHAKLPHNENISKIYVRELLERARLLSSQRKYEAASAHYAKILEFNQADDFIKNEYCRNSEYFALALKKENKLDEAAVQFKKAVDVNPKTAYRFDYFRLLKQLDRGDEVLEIYRKLVADSPEDALLLCDYAHELHTQKRDAEAFDQYQRAFASLDLKQKASIHIKYAMVLFALGKYEEILVFYEELLRDDPENDSIINSYDYELCYHVKTLLHDGEDEKAAALCKLSIETCPKLKLKEIGRKYRTLLKSLAGSDPKKLDELWGEYQSALNHEPQNVELLVHYARELMDQKKYEAAALQINEILKIDPSHPYAKGLMKEQLQHQQDQEAAVQYEEKLKAGSKEIGLRESYLEILRRLGNDERAEQIEREIVRLKWNPGGENKKKGDAEEIARAE